MGACFLLSAAQLKGFAIGTFHHCGVGFVCADGNAIQGAVIFAAAMVLTFTDTAFNRWVLHNLPPLSVRKNFSVNCAICSMHCVWRIYKQNFCGDFGV